MIKLAVVRQRFNPYGSSERSLFRALSVLRSQGKVEVTLITRRSEEAVMWRAMEVDPFYVTRTGRDRGFARAAAAAFDQFELVQSHERIPDRLVQTLHGNGALIESNLTGCTP